MCGADISLPYVWKAANPGDVDFATIQQLFPLLPRNITNKFGTKAQLLAYERRERLAKWFDNFCLTSRKSQHKASYAVGKSLTKGN